MVIGDLATAVDLIVLGGGPGGYVCAIRAAQLGKQVALVEPQALGGTCLNRGCIPSKALLQAADQWSQLRRLDRLGISVSESTFDFSAMQVWKNRIVQRLAKGVDQLLAGNGVQVVPGRGWFVGENEIRVEGEHGSQRFSFEHCVVAVGAEPAPLPDCAKPFDGKRVLNAEQALAVAALPAAATIVGADYIAAELATLYAKLGVSVTLTTPADTALLGDHEPAASRLIASKLRKLKVAIKSDAIETIEPSASDPVIVSQGLTPRCAELDLPLVGVTTDARGFISVDQRMQTSNPRIYAVGDVTGGEPLAVVAIKQAKVAAEHLSGNSVHYAPRALPRVVWSDPLLAAVGLTEQAATAAGYDVVSERFSLAANGRALTLDASDGFALVVAERGSEVLLGITLVGAGAETVIGEAALALEMGATITDIAETLHPHPGLGEPFQEAAEALLGLPVHTLKPK